MTESKKKSTNIQTVEEAARSISEEDSREVILGLITVVKKQAKTIEVRKIYKFNICEPKSNFMY